jgi:hypothetical protein
MPMNHYEVMNYFETEPNIQRGDWDEISRRMAQHGFTVQMSGFRALKYDSKKELYIASFEPLMSERKYDLRVSDKVAQIILEISNCVGIYWYFKLNSGIAEDIEVFHHAPRS